VPNIFRASVDSFKELLPAWRIDRDLSGDFSASFQKKDIMCIFGRARPLKYRSVSRQMPITGISLGVTDTGHGDMLRSCHLLSSVAKTQISRHIDIFSIVFQVMIEFLDSAIDTTCSIPVVWPDPLVFVSVSSPLTPRLISPLLHSWTYYSWRTALTLRHVM
jgi:hypothetical protein